MLVLSGIHLDWYGCRAVFSGMLICANDALAALATIRTCRTLQYVYIHTTPYPYAQHIAMHQILLQAQELLCIILGYLGIVPYVEYEILTSLLQCYKNSTNLLNLN